MCTPVFDCDVAAASIGELRELLEGGARLLDRLAARWLVALAEFDRVQGYLVDGCLSTVDWLLSRGRLSRSTAFEKLRVACELRHRPLVREALLDGRISYSAARAITRAVGAAPAVDAALIDLALAGTVSDVERMVRVFLRHAAQDRPPSEPEVRRGVALRPNHDGTTEVVATLTDVEAAELAARLARAPVTSDVTPTAGTTRSQRADALMDLVRSPGSEHRLPAADRYMVHHLVDHVTGSVTLVDGTAVDQATSAAVRCDATDVVHLLDPSTSEPLALGRARRTWNTAQRRAITVRDGGRCRFPGCELRTADVHHVTPWDDGGTTDASNGVLLCPRHHTLTHAGWLTTGTADGALTWLHPATALPVGTSVPQRPLVRRVLAALVDD